MFPQGVPACRSRAENFDQTVLAAISQLELRWPTRIASLEFAVDEAPPVHKPVVVGSPDMVLDGGIPLTRFTAPGVNRKGRPTKARVVIYRRPLELRANDPEDLADLVEQVLAEQLAAVLGDDETMP